LDREDIFSLSREIDDVLAAAKSTIEEMQVFKAEPSPELIVMAKILERGTLEIDEAANRILDIIVKFE
jgi:uncharacterized protein Yka (UPF0111/DUF47 family)